MKIFKKRIMWISFLVCVFLLAGYTGFMMQKYPQQMVEREQLYGKNQKNLKDFKMEGNGIRSVSGDPWIEYSVKGIKKIRTIELDFSGITVNDCRGCVWNMNTWEHKDYPLKNGKNYLLYEEEIKNPDKLRFDLVESSDVYLQADRVVINSKTGIAYWALKQSIPWMVLFMLSETFLLSYVEIRNGKLDLGRKRTGKMVYFLVIVDLSLFFYHIFCVKCEAVLKQWLYIIISTSLALAVCEFSVQSNKNAAVRLLRILLYSVLNFGIIEILSGRSYDFTKPQAWIWNVLLWIFVISLCDLCTGSMKFSVILSNIIALCLGMINHYFYQFRSNPFQLSDFKMAGTALTVIKNYHFAIDSIMVFVIITEWLVIDLGRLLDKRNYPCRKKMFRTEAVIAGLTWMCCVINDLDVSYWDMNQSTQEYGYLNAFVKYVRNDFGYLQPDGYSRVDVEKILNRYQMQEGEKKPNVIVIMNESFADLPSTYEFQTNIDGMPFFHGLRENTIKGKMLVSVFGGTTANTEYEFMMGNSMAYFPMGSVPYMQYVKIKQESFANELKKWGYQTQAFHPCNERNYNRNKVYPLLGFEKSFFIEDDIPYQDTLRDFVSDQADVDNVIHLYENREKDRPFFLFNVTMQNHGGYTGEAGDLRETVKPQETSLCEPSLVEYLSLVKKTDEAFEKLVRYFENVDEDTVIVMFGDHQPGLDETVYNKLGYHSQDKDLKQREKQYEVPFVIWANYQIDEENNVLISPNYLRAFLLEKAKMPLGCYDQFLLECQEEYPAINALGYYDKNKNFHEISENTELLQEYQILQYAKVFDKKMLQNVFNKEK